MGETSNDCGPLLRRSRCPGGRLALAVDVTYWLRSAFRQIIFAHYGYPWLIHRLTYCRAGHHHLHVRGFKEEGTTTTTPFDMLVLNDMDRFHLIMDVIDRTPGLARRTPGLRQHMVDARAEHRTYVRRTGEDLPEVRDWTWPTAGPTPEGG
jgi:xylulose-5-phosphate/fructose-6-phosphate phosphoketolase